MSEGFSAKIKIKRKVLPTRPIHIKLQASPEEQSEGGQFGSSSPVKADESAFSFPSSPKPKIKGAKAVSGKRGQYK